MIEMKITNKMSVFTIESESGATKLSGEVYHSENGLVRANLQATNREDMYAGTLSVSQDGGVSINVPSVNVLKDVIEIFNSICEKIKNKKEE